jgi:hypothetical protein
MIAVFVGNLVAVLARQSGRLSRVSSLMGFFAKSNMSGTISVSSTFVVVKK